jgi:hypothetical protein
MGLRAGVLNGRFPLPMRLSIFECLLSYLSTARSYTRFYQSTVRYDKGCIGLLRLFSLCY